MGNIFEKFETILQDSGASSFFSLKYILFVISKIYGGAVKLRRTFYRKSVLRSKMLSCPVISIGNITVGGTGKTPMTIYVANIVKDLGYKVVIISRGYKGGAEKIGGIVSDGKTILMAPEIAGDEPYMMAARLRGVPVVVGKNRFKAGRLAIRKFEPDILVLDDGFQHLKLNRDLDLVLLDYRKPFGNGYLLPRGVMREPASALKYANAIILTRSDTPNDKDMKPPLNRLRFYERTTPVFRSFHKPIVYKIVDRQKNFEALRQNPDCIKGRTAFAFSGLADNDNFRRTLKKFECNISGYLGFSDHHSYSDRDLKDILGAAERSKSECLITTEKDYVRIAHKLVWPFDLYVVGIEIEFGIDEKRFNDFIKDRLMELREKVR